jgi:hypothetical protein
MILISFGSSWLIFMLGKTLGCVSSLDNSPNDNPRGKFLMLNFGVGVSDAVDFVCEVVGVATEFGTS